MKIRNGFVSNSSSSSFIIHKSEIGEENFNELIKFLKKFEHDNDNNELGGGWGDSGQTFNVNGNYICIETYYINDSTFHETLKKLGITNKNSYSTYY